MLSLTYNFKQPSDGSDDHAKKITTLMRYTYCIYSATIYCNRGHLDKVHQSDYRKITIHSIKVGCGQSATCKKNDKLLEAQKFNIDRKRFSVR